MKKPLVSIIIPTFSRPDNLSRAINSALAQTYSPIEIIVVDDNGAGTKYQEETERSLTKYILEGKIKYIKHEVNKNGSAARNTGFHASKGDFVNFVDDDDTLAPKKIELQVRHLQEMGEEYGSCYCWVDAIHNDIIVSRRRWTDEGNLLEEYLLNQVTFHTTTHLLRRSVVEKLGGFDETFIRNQDVEFLTRFFRYYKICVASGEVLVNKYFTPSSSLKGKKWFFEVREKFINTFADDINKLAKHDKIFFLFYTELFNYAIKYGFYKEAHRYYNLSQKYGFVGFTIIAKSISDRIKILLKQVLHSLKIR